MSRSKQPLTIAHAILGFLREQALHGYELYQRLSAPTVLGSIWPLKQSQFYALVTRLESEGYLTVTPEARGALPPRKLLQLTPDGAEAFHAWLAAGDDPPDERERAFLVRLYFAHQLGAPAVHQLLASQRQVRRAWLQALRHDLHNATPHSYPWLLHQWQVRQAEAMLDWLDTFSPPPSAPGITYPIAVIADSLFGALARQFVAYVCGPVGQALLARHGFLPAGEPLAAAPIAPVPMLPHAGSLTIFAAASLTTAFEALAAAFGAAHPQISVRCTFGGSQALAADLARGARADVFAPAHHGAMEAAISAGRVQAGAIHTFAHNQLAIVTPTRRPILLQSLSDLARPGLRLAFGSEATAIGRYTQDVLATATQVGTLGSSSAAAVLENVVYYAETVTGVLTRVVQGEVDAGIVFTSDYYRAGGAVQVAVVPPLR
jgi:molybdate transport system substrate-binding protein